MTKSSPPPRAVRDRVHAATLDAAAGLESARLGDCLAHALACAGALSAAGFEGAGVQVGAAWWVVGPGATDVVQHGLSRDGRTTCVDISTGKYHAWAVYGPVADLILVDCTLYQIRDFARRVSARDGMPLTVTVPVPPYLWSPLPPVVSVHAARPGDCCYLPDDAATAQVVAEIDIDSAIRAGFVAYRSLLGP